MCLAWGLARTRGWTHELRAPCGPCVGWQGHVGGRMGLDRHVSYVLANGGLQVAWEEACKTLKMPLSGSISKGLWKKAISHSKQRL